MHRIGDAVQEINQTEERDKSPAVQLDIECEIDDNRGGQNPNDKPGLEFAPSGAGAFNDVAHQRIVQGVEDTGSDHDRSDGAELGISKLMREQYKGQQITVDQVVHHIPADSAEREHP